MVAFAKLPKAQRRLINRIRWARKVLAEAPAETLALALEVERVLDAAPPPISPDTWTKLGLGPEAGAGFASALGLPRKDKPEAGG